MTRRHVSRRQVLGAAAGAVAFPYIVPSSVFGAAAPSGKITMGCIGVGSQGSGNMNGFLDKEDDARILAVCDVVSRLPIPRSTAR